MPPDSQPNEDRFRQVWDGDSETDCVEACRDLQKAGIKYEVSQLPVGLSGRMGVDWRFEVCDCLPTTSGQEQRWVSAENMTNQRMKLLKFLRTLAQSTQSTTQ